MFSRALKMVLGSKHEREVKKLQPIVNAIGQLEPKMQKLSDADLRARTADFKQKLANGAPLDDLLIPAFATVRDATITSRTRSRRRIIMRWPESSPR